MCGRVPITALLRRVTLPIATLFAVFQINGDVLELQGGERIVGKIISEDPTSIVFDSRNLGRSIIGRDKIERIERDEVATPTVTSAPTNPMTISTNQAFYPWITSAKESSFDWLQLKTGEWLKGKLKSMDNDKLQFDSEKLDNLTFDWKDISIVYSPRLTSVLFNEKRTALGEIFVTSNEVRVINGNTNSYPRSELVAITPSGKREIDHWTAKLSAGLSLQAGNTKQATYNAQAEIQRRSVATRFSLDYVGNFAETTGEQTANNHRVTTEFDYFFSQRLFMRVPSIEYYHDPLQNLASRVTAGAAVGYDLVHGPRLEWNVTAGPAYQHNWYESVVPGEAPDKGAAAAVLSSRFDWDITDRLELITQYRGQITSRSVGETTHHGSVSLEFKIHKHLDLDLSFFWDRVSNPKTDADGITPLKDDFRLVTSLGVQY